MSTFSVTLDLSQSPAELFRFLADPQNRPLWQSSLKSVADVDAGEPRLGMRWRDVTKVGVKPRMEITELTPYRVLSEVGTWYGVRGELTLRFLRISQGTRLTAEGSVTGKGPFAVAAALSVRLAPEEIRKDLLKAGHVVAGRPA